MLLAISIVKLIAEIALLALAGKGLLAILAGRKRAENVFYRILSTVSQPVERATRVITPRVVIDAHIPFAAFFLVLFIWVATVLVKIEVCLGIGMEHCR